MTFGLALTGKIDWIRAVWFWVAQFIGAIIAAFLLAYLLGPTSDVAGLGATVGSLTSADPFKAVVLEAILTFFLVAAVFGAGVSGRNGNAVGLAIGFVLMMDILMGGTLTGASMNPARTFGPALATGHLEYFWIYLVGPFVGAAAAAFLYDRVYLPKETPAPPLTRKERSKARH